MATSRYPEAAVMIAPNEVLEHALIGVLKNAATGMPELSGWVAGTVKKTPLTIHDINGQPLFHDFQVARGSKVFGSVRVAASKVLGSGVISTELGARSWDFDVAARKLAPRVKREFVGSRVSAPKLVCYSYPKLGVMFDVQGPNGHARAIYDVASLARVPEKPMGEAREGFYAWSMYDAIPDADRRLRLNRFKKVDTDRTSFTVKERNALLAARTLSPVLRKVKLPYRQQITRLLQFCNHYAYDHARSHHCFSLHGQQVDDYCAVATCQMILCYYRYYRTQDQIAPALGYSAGGGCPSDQSPGYRSMSCSHLASSFDGTPTWEKARDQINLQRPMKSGIPGHARACAGYSYVRWLFGGGITEKKLYIYDPWPWNADYALGGAVTWEDWDAVNHTNYVYANVDCS
jgi:hypothetical protein